LTSHIGSGVCETLLADGVVGTSKMHCGLFNVAQKVETPNF